MSEELSAAQEALVKALVGGGPLPEGFDAARVDAARRALLRKRAGEVAKAWPLLAAALGPDAFPTRFTAWADGRPSEGSSADGLAFAQHLRATGALPPLAERELTTREPKRPWYRRL
jgi:hypothetical protein